MRDGASMMGGDVLMFVDVLCGVTTTGSVRVPVCVCF